MVVATDYYWRYYSATCESSCNDCASGSPMPAHRPAMDNRRYRKPPARSLVVTQAVPAWMLIARHDGTHRLDEFTRVVAEEGSWYSGAQLRVDVEDPAAITEAHRGELLLHRACHF